jgi:hypothetical protein
MEKIDLETKDLENAIDSAKAESSEEATKEAEAPQLSPEEEKGFHKGALNTLVAERGELVKMIGNVEAIMQAHLKRLKELGVEIK